MLTLELLAVYGVAAKAASLVTIAISGFQGALAPHVVSSWDSSRGLRSLTKLFCLYILAASLLLIFLYIFGENIIIFLGTVKAINGLDVMLILGSAAVVNGLNIFLFGLIKALKTSLLSVIYILTAILNIFLNYFLVDLYDIQGAAFATLISACVGFLVHFYFSSKYLKLPFSSILPFCFIIIILSLNIFLVFNS